MTFSSFTSLVTPGVDGVHILRVFGTPIVSLPLLLYFFISVSLLLFSFSFFYRYVHPFAVVVAVVVPPKDEGVSTRAIGHKG